MLAFPLSAGSRLSTLMIIVSWFYTL